MNNKIIYEFKTNNSKIIAVEKDDYESCYEDQYYILYMVIKK